jgi:hypothetical protein
MKFGASRRQPWSWGVALGALGLIIVTLPKLVAQGQGRGGRGQEGPAYSLSDPAPQDPALRGAIDLHAHKDPDSNGPSYGQAARSLDAMDLVKRAKASGMRGFVIKQHLDQSREDSGARAAFGKQSLDS